MNEKMKKEEKSMAEKDSCVANNDEAIITPRVLLMRPSDNAENKATTSVSLRDSIGLEMIKISDTINENVVAFRYGGVATVLLLSAYGFANTPLFFGSETSAIFLPRTSSNAEVCMVV